MINKMLLHFKDKNGKNIDSTITSIINERAISVEYQPIMDLRTNTVFGYEALARFSIGDDSFPPNHIFRLCHHCDKTMFLLELLVKEYQVKHRPVDKKLFLNLDSHSINADGSVEFWIDLFGSEQNIVVEILENSSQKNIIQIESFISKLKFNDICYALDDLFQDNSFFSSKNFIDAPMVKLDMTFLLHIRENKCYIEFLKGIVNFCGIQNKILILEGVETKEDLELAREAGILFVQGFYFDDHFIYA